MQAKESVEIDRTAGLIRLLDGDRAAEIVILAFAVRHDHIQAIDRTSLKNSDQNLLLAITLRSGLGRRELMQKFRRRRHKAKASQPDPSCLQKISSVHE